MRPLMLTTSQKRMQCVAPYCIEFECRLEVSSTVAGMRWRNHVDWYAPYENEGPRAELVPPIVGCASPGLR